jgi:nucleoid-associated protein YgaU
MKLATMFGSSANVIGATFVGAVVLIAAAVGVSVYSTEPSGEATETVAAGAVESSPPEAGAGTEAETDAGTAAESAPEANGEGAADEDPETPAPAPAPEPEPEPAPPLEAPRLDVVRVDAEGNAVIAGQTSPDLPVAIVLDGEDITVARADGSGAFVALLSLDPSDTPRMLSVEARPENGSVLAGLETVLIAPFPSPAATEIAATGEADDTGSGPQGESGAPEADAAPEEIAAAETAPEGPETEEVAASDTAPDVPETGAAAGSTEVAAAETPATTPAADPASAPEVEEIALADTGAAPMPVADEGEPSAEISEIAEPASDTDAAGAALADGATERPEAPQTAEALPASDGAGAEGDVTEGTRTAGGEASGATAEPGDGSGAALEVATATPTAPTEPIQRPREVDAEAPGAPAAEDQPAAEIALDAGATVPEAAAEAAEIAATAEVGDTPDTTTPAPTLTQSGAPAVVIAGPEGVRVVQGGASSPSVQTSVQLDAISYNTEGAVILAGRGPVASDIQVYLNNQPIQLGEVGAGGDWSLQLPDVDPGTYTLTVAGLDADGTTTSSVETPFLREDPERVAEAPRVAEGGIDVITVQPGFTLWGIAEDSFGEGILYVQIFEENRDQIRDPDWIFPGQIFRIPELAPEAEQN